MAIDFSLCDRIAKACRRSANQELAQYNVAGEPAAYFGRWRYTGGKDCPVEYELVVSGRIVEVGLPADRLAELMPPVEPTTADLRKANIRSCFVPGGYGPDLVDQLGRLHSVWMDLQTAEVRTTQSVLGLLYAIGEINDIDETRKKVLDYWRHELTLVKRPGAANDPDDDDDDLDDDDLDDDDMDDDDESDGDE